MNKRNLLTGLMVFGMAFALLFAGCTPLDGDLDDIREKAWEENHGGEGGIGGVSSTVISSVNIQITAPAKGVAPSTTGSTTDTGYSLASVSWQPNNNPFQGSTKYTTTVTLVAENGYTFTGLTTAKINTNTATISNNNGGSVILSYEFPATLANTVTGITINAQPTKLSYKQEETLNLAGLIVTLSYDAGPADNVAFANFGTYGITTSPSNGTTLSRSTHDGKPVTVSHGSFSKTTNNLTVIAPPDMPQNFSATAGNGQVTLSWSSQTESGGSAITGYQVYRDGTGGGTWITATSNTSHTFINLTNGTSYTFKVRAVNAAGNGVEASMPATPVVKTYTVNFNSNSGSSVSSQTVTEGGKATKPVPDPTRTGYRFDGWYADTGLSVVFDFPNTPINANTTIYAKWTAYCDVQFNANGGSGSMTTMRYYEGDPVKALTNSTFTAPRGKELEGWTVSGGSTVYSNGHSFSYATLPNASPGGTVTLYAKWKFLTIPTSLTTVNDILNWLVDNAGTGGEYTVTATYNQTVDRRSLPSGTGYSSYKVILKASNPSISISVPSSDFPSLSLLTVESGVTLVLENITLKGSSSNNSASLVTVNTGGILEMNTDATINGNRKLVGSGGGGGVFVNGGSFTMYGGTISNNTHEGMTGIVEAEGKGGGVYVASGGSFTMNGGTIFGNTAKNGPSSYGGGVYVASGGSFTKTGNGSIIYGNTGDANANSAGASGYAAYVDGATPKFRNSTATSNMSLNSASNGNWGS